MIYWALVPYILNQAASLGAVVVYHEAWQEYKQLSDQEREQRAMNPYLFFVFGLFFILFQRFISSITMYFMLLDWKAACFQFLDVLMVRAIRINYDLDLKEPCNPQRYISILVRYNIYICISDCYYSA